MALEFPQFADPYLQYVDVCAFIDEADARGIITDTIDQTTSYSGEGGGKIIGGIATGWVGKEPARSLHVHLRFAAASLFEGRDEPQLNATAQQIVTTFGLIEGRRADVKWDSRFVVPLSSVPQTAILVPLLEITAEAQSLSMRMTGGRFSILTRPLDRLSWALRESGSQPADKLILADVVGYASEILDANLVNRAIRAITPAIDAFILGGDRRDTSRAAK